MLKIKTDCTACGACEQICPRKCIVLKSNARGMVFPEIDEAKCINCNLCEKVCHLNHTPSSAGAEQRAYAVAHASRDVLSRSTSGGAFTAIAKYVLERGGAVCGCAYDEDLTARHIWAENEQELLRLNGSKYVQSVIGNTYQQAKARLEKGGLVLFSGTPCQISGLKAFLGKEYDNLITVDIVCHGVAPQAYFKQYIGWLEDKYKCRITNYDFRSKRNAGWGYGGIVEGVDFNSGKKVTKKIFYINEYYYYYFLKGAINRESCYSCKYANMNRPGDFSLGDMWGAERLKLEYSIDGGCSLVLANNAKANSILDALEINKTEIPVDFAVKYNHQLRHAPDKPMNRDEVLDKFVSLSPKEIDAWFKKSNVTARLKGKLKRLVPYKVKKIILKYKA